MLVSQNSVPTPDYDQGKQLLYWAEWAMDTPVGLLADYAYKGMQTKEANFSISDSQCFKVPKDGYIVVSDTFGYSKFWQSTNQPFQSLFVNLSPAGKFGSWRHVFISQYSKDIGSQSFTSYIPVNKGDQIAVGVQNAGQILPRWCVIDYYPIKLKDASSI